MDGSSPADDLRELLRLAHAAIHASYEGSGWTNARDTHSKHYALICERCRNAEYHEAYLTAVRADPAIADRARR